MMNEDLHHNALVIDEAAAAAEEGEGGEEERDIAEQENEQREQPIVNFNSNNSTREHHHSPRNPLEALVDWWKGLLPAPPPPPPPPPPASVGHDRDSHHCRDKDTTNVTTSSSCTSSSSLVEVTLHFDVDANCCVAVLSKADDRLCSVYFECRVQQGTARQHSVLYYELDGFLRQQYTTVQRAIHPHNVHLAVGALELSDQAQMEYLQDQRRQAHVRRHPKEEQQQQSSSSSSSSSNKEELLAQVLDIARLYRLTEDLDVLSLYFLGQVNTTCRQVARSMMQQQQQQVTVTPYVDGANVLGYSRLLRQDESNLVQHAESGRLVVYRQCPSVTCHHHHHHHHCGKQNNHRYIPTSSPTPSFSWACEEIALAHLHQWWGDIAERDYIGQKLIIQWQQDSPPYGSDSSILLDTLRLEAGPPAGTRTWQTSKLAITLHVAQSETRVIDNVTLAYSGQADIRCIQVPWMTFVRAYCTKVEWPRLTAAYADLQQNVRPLLPHELEYGELVHALVYGK